MNRTRCDQPLSDEQLLQLLTDPQETPEQKVRRQHLRECDSCFVRYSSLEASLADQADLEAFPSAPSSLRERLQQTIEPVAGDKPRSQHSGWRRLLLRPAWLAATGLTVTVVLLLIVWDPTQLIRFEQPVPVTGTLVPAETHQVGSEDMTTQKTSVNSRGSAKRKDAVPPDRRRAGGDLETESSAPDQIPAGAPELLSPAPGGSPVRDQSRLTERSDRSGKDKSAEVHSEMMLQDFSLRTIRTLEPDVQMPADGSVVQFRKASARPWTATASPDIVFTVSEHQHTLIFTFPQLQVSDVLLSPVVDYTLTGNNDTLVVPDSDRLPNTLHLTLLTTTRDSIQIRLQR